MPPGEYRSFAVWDLPTRLFHWINVIAVILLAALGIALLNEGNLNFNREGKLFLKRTHVLIGYVMTANLLWRLIWGFFGNRYARWSKSLPFTTGYIAELRDYVRSLRQKRQRYYLGHNPLGRLSVLALLVLLAIMAGSGLILAGTDLFYPPFGGLIAQWVALPGTDPAALIPATPAMVDPVAFQEMRRFRSPVVSLHIACFYVLAGMVCLHICAVVIAEVREGSGLVSAMISGKREVPERPTDID